MGSPWAMDINPGLSIAKRADTRIAPQFWSFSAD